MAEALIALGGNVDDVRATFRAAVPAICVAANATLLARSSDYVTPPWGEEDQPPFVNACIAIATPLPPAALLRALHRVERSFGRDRARERRWGPRRLDLDILAVDDLRVDTEELILPHPRMFDRAFVLVPLAEIAPDRPIGARTARAALLTMDTTGIVRLPDGP
jgi:2-amino-4-hydroxy-6-hydroxymethyldihydropteridine diphosphokinase